MNRTGIMALMGLLILSLGIMSCGSNSSSPVYSACSVNNTATITFANYSTSGTYYDITLDGSRSASYLAPGNTTGKFTISAGVAHIVDFKIAGTNTLACTEAYPNEAKCSSHTMSCSK